VAGAGAADALPASDKDAPTSPTTGTISFGCFRFEARFVCGIVYLPRLLANVAKSGTVLVRFAFARGKDNCDGYTRLTPLHETVRNVNKRS
jgi:hypothetical protein